MNSKLSLFIILNSAYITSAFAQDWLMDRHDTAYTVTNDGLLEKVRMVKEARYKVVEKNGKIISTERDTRYKMYSSLYDETGKLREYTPYD